MSSAKIDVVFEGPAVTDGTMDARLLADSLLGYSEVFRRANELANGDASEAVVLVQSEFKKGSFIAGIQLIQNLVGASQLITSHPFMDAQTLAASIGFVFQNKERIQSIANSVLDLFKWLKGKKPDKVTRIANNNVELTFGQKKTVTSETVYNFYGDEAIRAGLAHIASPLRNAAIDRVLMKQDGAPQGSIEKLDAEYFGGEPLELEAENKMPMEGDREAVLVVSKLSFTEGPAWTFFEQGATVVAKIEDQNFWEKVHKHEVVFGEGDVLRVRLSWKIERKRKLTQKNTIVKVHNVRTRPEQLKLASEKKPH
jgi:hypothetical protein